MEMLPSFNGGTGDFIFNTQTALQTSGAEAKTNKLPRWHSSFPLARKLEEDQSKK